eukprot:Partr_v1_DN28521_c1_g1_i2_m73686 putative integral membrane protein
MRFTFGGQFSFRLLLALKSSFGWLALALLVVTFDILGTHAYTNIAIPMWWSLWSYLLGVVLTCSEVAAFRRLVDLKRYLGFYFALHLVSFLAYCYRDCGEGVIVTVVGMAYILFLALLAWEPIFDGAETTPILAGGVFEKNLVISRYGVEFVTTLNASFACRILKFIFVLVSCLIVLASVDAVQTAIIHSYGKSDLVQLPYGPKIWMECAGNGSPTVIFESGLAACSTDAFPEAFAAASNVTRTCWYHRPGYGYSESYVSSSPIQSRDIARILAQTLEIRGETGPFVSVSHSFGGVHSRVFAFARKQKMAGMLLVESSDETQYVTRLSWGDAFIWDILLHSLSPLYIFDGIIAPIIAKMRFRKPRYTCIANDRWFKAQNSEMHGAGMDGFRQALVDRITQKDFGNTPLTVITAAKGSGVAYFEELMRMGAKKSSHGTYYFPNNSAPLDRFSAFGHRALANLSSRSLWEIDPSSTHLITIENPKLIAMRLLELIQQARSKIVSNQKMVDVESKDGFNAFDSSTYFRKQT